MRFFFSFLFSTFAFVTLSVVGGFSQEKDSLKIVSDTLKITQKKNYVTVNEIKIIGNKVTKQHIILRELQFALRDTIQRSEVSKFVIRAKQNLLNTSLFNFVSIDTAFDNYNNIDFTIKVSERWYTWPAPIFEVQERNINTWWREGRNLNRANYGFFLTRNNFRGRKEDLSFYFQFGYTEKYGLTYKIPYLTKGQNSGAGIGFSYSRNREIPYTSINDQVVYFKDPDKYIRQEFNGKINYTYRDGIHNSHYLETRYVQALVDDTLKSYTNDYFMPNETQIKYFLLDYFYKSDFRDSRMYPLQGYYFELNAQHYGFGILPEEKIDVSNLLLTFKNFEKLSKRFYFSDGVKVKLSPNKKDEPYYVQGGLGWSNYVRGYEYYVIDGQSWALGKINLKYELVKPHVYSVNVPGFSKFNTFHYAFYANIFADGGYVKDYLYYKANPLANQFLFGYGAGIDYVTYYDLVIRFEYSFNRMGENGFFLHFDAGI